MDQIATPSLPASRRRATVGYPNGEDTRVRLLTAAMAVFGERGFDGASTRDIAAKAGVRSPALGYYFGDKLGVYLACVDTVTSQIAARIEPAIEDAKRCIAARADVPALITCICDLQDHLMESFYTPGEGDSVRALLWDAPTDVIQATTWMEERVQNPTWQVQTTIIGEILGKPKDDLFIGIHAAALNGLSLGFYLNEPRFSAFLGWDPRGPGNLDVLKRVLRLQATTLLKGLSLQAGTWPK